jgi:hypothetical protein
MAKNWTDLQPHLICLRKLVEAEKVERGAAIALARPDASDDPMVADGLRLVRSFLWIEDEDARNSIIDIVETIAEKYTDFKNKRPVN